jgi:hypothetical protein
MVVSGNLCVAAETLHYWPGRRSVRALAKPLTQGPLTASPQLFRKFNILDFTSDSPPHRDVKIRRLWYGETVELRGYDRPWVGHKQRP